MIENKISSLKKDKFLRDAEKDLSQKSFLDKHYNTILPTKAASYIFSFISVVFGCIAVYATSLNAIGINTTLLDSFNKDSYLPYIVLLFSFAFLSIYELGKHHFYKEGFLEYYRNTDSFGGREIAVAVLLQIVSISLSFYGGVIASNEIAGVQKTEALYAIQAEYDPLIATAKQNKEDFVAAKSWKGKISDKNTKELNRLQSVVDNLELSYLNAKKEAGVTDGFVAANAEGTKKMSYILGGSQIVIEIFLTFALWWLVYLKSRAIFEAGIIEYSPTLSDRTLFNAELPSPVLSPITAKRQIGFFKDAQDTQHTHSTHSQDNTQHTNKAESTVTQRSQEYTAQSTDNTHVNVIDLSKEKKRVKVYIQRINKAFTPTLLQRLRSDISKLANFGYSVSYSDNKVTINNDLKLGTPVNVTYADNRLVIKYHK